MSHPGFSHLIVFPRLRVQNANAISSPLTHGFPSMTAFLGLMWAVERAARRAGLALEFNAVGVVSHGQQEQLAGSGFVKTLRLTRNPVGKDGGTAAIVEEGRIHLDLSLVFAVHAEGWDADAQVSDLAKLGELLPTLRIAGGTLLPPAADHWRRRPFVADFTSSEPEDRSHAFRQLAVRLLPGSTLVLREDLIDQRLAELHKQAPEATRLDAWLSLSRINWRYDGTAEGGKGAWLHDRADLGWIVPIPVGYGALGDVHPPGSVRNARDAVTPFRFVESLYSIGEWIGPHRLRRPEHMLWYAESSPQDGLYRCRNDYRVTTL